jgi:hypothetical protein
VGGEDPNYPNPEAMYHVTFILDHVIFFYSIFLLLYCSESYSGVSGLDASTGDALMLRLREMDHGSCTYMAAWLASVNLYRRTSFYADIARAEAASLEIRKAAWQKYMLLNQSSYFVHHMSHFEHVNHLAHGFPVAEFKTALMAQAAARGECNNIKKKKSGRDNIFKNRDEYVAFIPFFGGRPTNGSNYFSDSLGHGNSIVSYGINTCIILVSANSSCNSQSQQQFQDFSFLFATRCCAVCLFVCAT